MFQFNSICFSILTGIPLVGFCWLMFFGWEAHHKGLFGSAKREPILSRIYMQTTFYSGVLSTSFMIAEVIRVVCENCMCLSQTTVPQITILLENDDHWILGCLCSLVPGPAVPNQPPLPSPGAAAPGARCCWMRGAGSTADQR